MAEQECTLNKCAKDVADLTKQSFSIVRWNPETQSNELVGMFCSAHHLLEWLDEEVPM